MIKKETDIKINISLDENNIPEIINWTAQDGNIIKEPCHAFVLSLWNFKKKDSYRIDLWTKEMLLKDMNIFFYQIFVSMADTYKRATSNDNIAIEIYNFGQKFAKLSSLITNK
ncbi:MAG: gliding motility protein GldC [Candidatus Bostrichicola ureolyticus]|nr:MAG: gliding motility protein GldC [Candidatus Bostrichicola ureolyticus]